jgi:hypothetical protein
MSLWCQGSLWPNLNPKYVHIIDDMSLWCQGSLWPNLNPKYLHVIDDMSLWCQGSLWSNLNPKYRDPSHNSDMSSITCKYVGIGLWGHYWCLSSLSAILLLYCGYMTNWRRNGYNKLRLIPLALGRCLYMLQFEVGNRSWIYSLKSEVNNLYHLSRRSLLKRIIYKYFWFSA